MVRPHRRIAFAGAVLAAALPAVSRGEDGDAPRPDTYAAPVSVPASFNPLLAMWGLRELGADTRLADLDEALVLYLDERAIFATGAVTDRLYLAGGRQLVTDGPLTEAEIADQLLVHPCLCAIEYDAAMPGETLHTAAGAYRVASVPFVLHESSGITRVEFTLSAEGQTERVTLRRLVCWSAGDDTVGTLAATLPRFVKLTSKQHRGFVDPPVDDRPVTPEEIRQPRREETLFVADEYDALDGGRPWYLRGSTSFDGRESGQQPWYRQGSTAFEARDPLRTTRPGILAFLREVGTGDRLTIDYSDYYQRGFDTWSRDLDRRQGIYFRDPYAFP